MFIYSFLYLLDFFKVKFFYFYSLCNFTFFISSTYNLINTYDQQGFV